jgi:glucan biosynthesis protein C
VSEPPAARLHSLDAMRAAMMLLGLVLHSAVSYTFTPLGAAWPYQDRSTSALFDWIVFFIHLFRMPAFFVMAGFFAAFLYNRDGVRGFLAHRIRRLLLPLVAFWIAVFPLCRAGLYYAVSGGGRAGIDPAWTQLSRAPYGEAALAHLWFIYYLLCYCLAAIVLAPALDRIAGKRRAVLLDRFADLTPRVAGCVFLGLVTAATLIPMEKPGLDTSFSFLPAVRVLIAYAVFFTFGWLLFLRKGLVPSFARHPWRFTAAGFAMGVLYLVVAISQPLGPNLGSHLAAVIAGGVATWLLIYGITGLFVRYFERPRPLQRYLSDASYWMYLIHLPFVIWMAGLLAPVQIPAFLKFTIVLGVVTVVTVTTYHLFVRSTAIGAFLNGRRFGRSLPALEPARSTGPSI